MAFKSVFKPEGSIVAGVATVGLVVAVYEMNVGSVAQAHASDANHPANASAKNKAGYTALAVVAAITLLSKDANVGILGGGTIIAMELAYRHAIMVNPGTGKMVHPDSGENQAAYPELTAVS